MHCERGSAQEYAALRRRLSRRETELARERSSQRRLRADESLRKLRTGDVIRVPAGRRAGLAVVLSEGAAVADTGRLVVLMADRQVKRLSVGRLPDARSRRSAKVRVGRSFNPRSPQSRRDLASSLRELDLGEEPRRAATGPTRGDEPGWRTDDEVTRLRQRAARASRARLPGARAAHALGRAGRPPAPREQPVSSSASRAVPTPSRAPSTGSAGCWKSVATSPPSVDAPGGRRPGGTPAGPDLRRVRPAGRRVPSARRLGRADRRRRWPRSLRRSSTSHAPMSTASRCFLVGRRSVRRSRRRSRCVTSSRRSRRRTGSISCPDSTRDSPGRLPLRVGRAA